MFSKTYLINLLFFGLVLLLLVIFSEVFLRLLHPYNDTNPVLVEADQILPYKMVANTQTKSIDGVKILIDSYGLRDIKPETNKSDEIKTYLVLGDSTTYGYGVEASQTFVERLQHARNEQTSNISSFINAGHSGFNLIDYANLLNVLNEKIEYDFLIVGLMNNDYTNTSLNYIFKNGIGITPGSLLDRHNVNAKLIKILRNSAIYLTVGNAIKGAKYNSSKPSIEKVSNNQNILASVNNSLEKIKKLADTRHSPVFLVYLPTKIELLNAEVHYPNFNAAIKKFADTNSDVYYLDLSKQVMLIDNVENIYFKTDWVHPNPAGHSIYCSEILKFINEYESNVSASSEC